MCALSSRSSQNILTMQIQAGKSHSPLTTVHDAAGTQASLPGSVAMQVLWGIHEAPGPLCSCWQAAVPSLPQALAVGGVHHMMMARACMQSATLR